MSTVSRFIPAVASRSMRSPPASHVSGVKSAPAATPEWVSPSQHDLTGAAADPHPDRHRPGGVHVEAAGAAGQGHGERAVRVRQPQVDLVGAVVQGDPAEAPAGQVDPFAVGAAADAAGPSWIRSASTRSTGPRAAGEDQPQAGSVVAWPGAPGR